MDLKIVAPVFNFVSVIVWNIHTYTHSLTGPLRSRTGNVQPLRKIAPPI